MWGFDKKRTALFLSLFGAVDENAPYYFLDCLLYIGQRNYSFSSVKYFNPLVNVHLLITNSAPSAETNIRSAVLKHIKDSIGSCSLQRFGQGDRCCYEAKTI